jgi:hypothetical protein
MNLLDDCSHLLDESRIIDAIGDVVVLDAQCFQHPSIIFGTLASQTCPLRNVVSATKFIVVKIPAMQRNVKFIGGYHEHVKNNDLNTCRLL